MPHLTEVRRKDKGTWDEGKERHTLIYPEHSLTPEDLLKFKKGDLENISDAGKKAVNKAIRRIESKLEERFGF